MAQYALENLTFNFVPDGLPLPDIIASEDINHLTANDIYRQAHKMAYNAWPTSDLGKHWQAAVANARTLKMDFKTYCLYIITGYMITHDKESKFYPVNLAANSALGKVETYRKACLQKFGVSDARSLGLMLNLEFFDIDEELLLSELSFGRLVVGHTLAGTENPPAAIYDMDEIAFSPYWLAIEWTYAEAVFSPYLKAVRDTPHRDKHLLGTDAQLRHRHLVSQVRSALKRRSHLASTIFAARSRIMPKAVKSVLEQRNILRTALISDTKIIEDAYTFWTMLGTHIKHLAR